MCPNQPVDVRRGRVGATLFDPAARTEPLGSQERDRQTFIHTLRAERIKLLSTRSALVMALAALVAPMVVCVATLTLSRDPGGVNLVTAAMSTWPIVLVCPAVVVTGAFTGEVGTGTLRVTYACTPRRLRVGLAKLAVGVGYTVTVLACVLAMTVAVGAAIQTFRGFSAGIDADGPTRLALGIVVGVLYAIAGLAAGYLLRATAAAATLVSVYPFAEAILRDLVRGSSAGELGRWFPLSAALDAAYGVTDVVAYGVVTLGRPWGVLYFAALIVALVVAVAFSEGRRDA